MREFMLSFMGPHVPNLIPSYFVSQAITATQMKQYDIYEPMDTIQQYLEHFINYRKQTRPPMSSARI